MPLQIPTTLHTRLNNRAPSNKTAIAPTFLDPKSLLRSPNHGKSIIGGPMLKQGDSSSSESERESDQRNESSRVAAGRRQLDTMRASSGADSSQSPARKARRLEDGSRAQLPQRRETQAPSFVGSSLSASDQLNYLIAAGMSQVLDFMTSVSERKMN